MRVFAMFLSPYKLYCVLVFWAWCALACPTLAYSWLPQPEKAELMVIHAHPDDEGIFFGGVLPYYTQVERRPTVLIDIISQGKNDYTYVRETELRNAAWTYGLRNEPLFARFIGYIVRSGQRQFINTLTDCWDAWDGNPRNGAVELNMNGVPDGREAAALFLAEQIRRYRPEVMATHDFDGEYGHFAHVGAALATADAFQLAANPAVNIAGRPAWQTKKLYIHQSQANGLGTEGVTFRNWLFHDYWENLSIDADGDGVPEKTPRQIAELGLKCHVSQGSFDVSTVYRVGENHDGQHCEWWGLYASPVGPDTTADPFTIMGYNYIGWARGTFFEHLPVPEPSSMVLLVCGLSGLLCDWVMDGGKNYFRVGFWMLDGGQDLCGFTAIRCPK